jgi:cyclic pyranopterin phosphate synthase
MPGPGSVLPPGPREPGRAEAATQEPAARLLDRLDRPLRDLRVSVTDRCNFRCPYCMPKEIFGRDHAFLPRAEILSFEEITRVVRAAASLGVTKVRLTGGEPLVRRDLERLVAMVAAVEGIHDLALTTNGALLAGKAQALREAGLSRVTVSLDSLDDGVFRAMNDRGVPLARVLEGIAAAQKAGLWPVKLNTVVKRGVNDHGLVDLARFARANGLIVRFIEYMDVGTTNGWRLDDVVPAAEVIRRIDAELPLEPAEPNYRGEVARRWRFREGQGEIGVIASVTQPFCRDCARARLSTDGKLYTCLFAAAGHDLRVLLRQGASNDDLRAALARIWRGRGDRYSELRAALPARPASIEMSYIGG